MVLTGLLTESWIPLAWIPFNVVSMSEIFLSQSVSQHRREHSMCVLLEPSQVDGSCGTQPLRWCHVKGGNGGFDGRLDLMVLVKPEEPSIRKQSGQCYT